MATVQDRTHAVNGLNDPQQGTAVVRGQCARSRSALAWAIDHELAEDGADRGNRCAASYSLGGNVTRAESAIRAASAKKLSHTP